MKPNKFLAIALAAFLAASALGMGWAAAQAADTPTVAAQQQARTSNGTLIQPDKWIPIQSGKGELVCSGDFRAGALRMTYPNGNSIVHRYEYLKNGSIQFTSWFLNGSSRATTTLRRSMTEMQFQK